MLPPDSRVVLTDQLRAPRGWRLDHAVATTFTLDLAAALSAPLAFAAHQLPDVPDPLTLMQAVRGCVDRVDVFCQAGHITVPASGSTLFAFLEPMLHQVRQPRPGRVFHPKMWLVRYAGPDGATAYRLLVLSRNLTGDRSWDVCLRLDGVAGDRRHRGNAPLVALLEWLTAEHRCVGGLDPARTGRIGALAQDLASVEWDRPHDIKDVRFHVLGIGRRHELSFEGTRHLVVSAFLNEAGLRHSAPHGSREVHVVSRQEELDRLPNNEIARVRPRVVNALAGLGDGDSAVLSGLHAKLYVIEYDHEARVLVGSANATDAAFGGNVELLAELSGSKHRFGIASMMGEDAAFADILEPYSRSEEPPPEDDPTLADLLRRIAGIPLVARVSRDAGHYRLDVSGEQPLPAFDDGTRITMEPLTVPGRAIPLQGGVQPDVAFAGLHLTQITPFFAVHATAPDGATRSVVVVATLVDDPPERLDTILANQIDSPEKFLRFVALLLGIVGGAAFPVGEEVGDLGTWHAGLGAGVFELLVRALVDQPEALETLGRLVDGMRRTEAGRRNLPAGFEALWAEIEQARTALHAESNER